MKIPKNTKELVWTNHVVGKMRHYGLSEQKVRSVLHRYARKEEGIAPHTIAVMQPSGSKKRPTEIWVMYQTVKTKSLPRNHYSLQTRHAVPRSAKRIITAWRYPGISPKRNPIPPGILDELYAFTRDGEQKQ